MDNSKESAPAAGSVMEDAVIMESFDMFADGGAAIESDMEYSYSESETTGATLDQVDDSLNMPSESYDADDIGMVVTLYGEIPEELVSSGYTVTYYENGVVEYIVPVDVARDIAEKYDNAEVDDTNNGTMAKIIITK